MGPSLTLSSACRSGPPEGMLAMGSTAMDRRLLLSAGAVRYTCKAGNAVSLIGAPLLTAGVVPCICNQSAAWHLQLQTWQCAVQLQGCQPLSGLWCLLLSACAVQHISKRARRPVCAPLTPLIEVSGARSGVHSVHSLSSGVQPSG